MKNIKQIIAKLSAIFTIALLIPIANTHAAENDVTLFLAQNCQSTPNCPEPTETDNFFTLSQSYNQGDLITLDVRIKNPTKQNIVSAQTWINYDTNQLEGVKIETSNTFDLVAPGEKEFDTENGRAKIGVASTSGGSQLEQILVATIQFKVKTTSKTTSNLSFYDYRLTELGHTNVNIIEGGFPVNVLSEPKKSLQIQLNGTSQSNNQNQNTNQNSQTTQPNIVLGRPTGLQIDTGSGYAHLKWEVDQNSQLAGYNIYYSMSSGRYLHRKTVGIVNEFYVTGLSNNQEYFFAVTAVDRLNNESDYSDEVAIVINQPATSSSPFYKQIHDLEYVLDPKQTANTGPKTDVAILIALISGIIGILIKKNKFQYTSYIQK